MVNTERKFDARKLLRPTADNCDEAVERIAWGLRKRGVDSVSVSNATQWLHEEIEQGALNPYTATIMAHEHAMAGALNLLVDAQGWPDFALAVNYARHAVVVRSLSERPYTDPMRGGDQALHLGLLALSRCGESIARPWAHRLYNLFFHRGIEADIGDDPVFAFALFLLHAYCHRRWPEPEALKPELEGFLPLLRAVGDSGTFKTALLDYCDWRLSRAYGFKDCQAKKPDSDVKYGYFIRQWIAICPFELLALQSVYHDVTGRMLDLAGNHPLLLTSLMSPPIFNDLATDALLEKVTEAGMRQFGERWQPEALVRLPD